MTAGLKGTDSQFGMPAIGTAFKYGDSLAFVIAINYISTKFPIKIRLEKDGKEVSISKSTFELWNRINEKSAS